MAAEMGAAFYRMQLKHAMKFNSCSAIRLWESDVETIENKVGFDALSDCDVWRNDFRITAAQQQARSKIADQLKPSIR